MELKEESRAVKLHSLLKSGKFSDLQLSCEGRDFAVHKAILCAQSPVLSAICEGGFLESETNLIKIEEFNANTVQRMLEFLYSGDYCIPQHIDSGNRDGENMEPAGSEDENGTRSLDSNEFDNNEVAITKKDVLCWHLSANAVGDYYDIQPLCTLARSKVKTALEEQWSPDDFLHLLTETCTTRKTGDVEFHRLLGQIMAKHLEDLAGFQDLGALDIPAEIYRSVVVSSTNRVRVLERKIQVQGPAIASLKAQVSNAHSVHDTLSTYSECRNSTCNETFPCYIEQDGITYNLRCVRCRCRH